MSTRQTALPQKRLLILSFLNGLVFYAPVALLVRTQTGITIGQFFLLQVILSVSILALEVPAGFISDRFGYRKSIVFAQTLLLIARLLLLLADSFALFAVEAVVEGLSASLISGTDSAYIYTFCRSEEYTVFNSRVARAGTIGFIASTIAYSLLLRLTDISGLVAATCVATLLGLVLALCLPSESAISPKTAPAAAKTRWHFPREWLLFFAILSAVSIACLVVNFFYAVKIERIGLGYESLSAVILGYSAIELLSPAIIRRIAIAAYPQAIAVAFGLCALSFCLMFVADSAVCVVLMLLTPLLLSIMTCLTDEIINESIDRHGLGDKRATVLSLLNMGNNVLEIGFLLVSAALSDAEGNAAFLIAGIYLCIVLCGILLQRLLRRKST